ncbi:hypothetical protein [Psittacicella hinzii]|uniref:hypothetical protein n=1 Tax=Psittacicella hinzii TaxID=2028575 RepID=UPI0011C3B4D7|nr:hypothetical protein [Psittacicella hinzii]
MKKTLLALSISFGLGSGVISGNSYAESFSLTVYPTKQVNSCVQQAGDTLVNNFAYEFTRMSTTCKLGTATKDYQPLPLIEGLEANLGANIISSTQVQAAFYQPLVAALSSKATTLQRKNAQQFVQDYFTSYVKYQSKGKYAFVIAPLTQEGSTSEHSQLTTTPYFFLQNGQEVVSQIHTPGLSVTNGQVVLAPQAKVAILLVDMQLRTNQSNLTIVLENLNRAQAVPIASSLNAYLDYVAAYAKQIVAKSKTQASTQNSQVDISNQQGGVSISGGSIQAGNIHISGQNVNISNSNIQATGNVDLKAQQELSVKQSEVSGKQVTANAQVINDDGSLAKAQTQSWSKFTLPRLVGIETYFNRLLNQPETSRAIIDLSLAGQLLQVPGLKADLSFEEYSNYLTQVLSRLNLTRESLGLSPSYMQEAYDFYTRNAEKFKAASK